MRQAQLLSLLLVVTPLSVWACASSPSEIPPYAAGTAGAPNAPPGTNSTGGAGKPVAQGTPGAIAGAGTQPVAPGTTGVMAGAGSVVPPVANAGNSGAPPTSVATDCPFANVDPATLNLVNATGWVGCEPTSTTDNPMGFQGAFYGYGDGTSCPLTTPGVDMCAGGKCCIKGKTVVDKEYKLWGCGLGLELSSTGGDPPVKSAYSGAAKCFDIELTGDTGGNKVRIAFSQGLVKEGEKKISPFMFDTAVSGTVSQKVCFSDVSCPTDWNLLPEECSITGSGTPYDLQIQIAGGDAEAAFDLCVTKIHPISDAGPVVTVPAGTLEGTGTISEKYGIAHVKRDTKDYIVINNVWGDNGSQKTQYNGTTFKITEQTGNNTGEAGPVSYPAVFLGVRSDMGNGTTAGSGLPKVASSITSIQTGWANNAKTLGNASGNFNASYDVWFNVPGSAGNPSGGYLMVWFWDPSGAQPIGESIGTVTIAGQSWTIWYGNNTGTGKPCVSYVSPQGLTALDFDLNLFIKDAITRKYIQSTWELTTIHAGFEIWSGGVGLETSAFYADVK